jgi:hypothetical protein
MAAFKGPPINEEKGIPCKALVATVEGVVSIGIAVLSVHFFALHL